MDGPETPKNIESSFFVLVLFHIFMNHLLLYLSEWDMFCMIDCENILPYLLVIIELLIGSFIILTSSDDFQISTKSFIRSFFDHSHKYSRIVTFSQSWGSRRFHKSIEKLSLFASTSTHSIIWDREDISVESSPIKYYSYFFKVSSSMSSFRYWNFTRALLARLLDAM